MAKYNRKREGEEQDNAYKKIRYAADDEYTEYDEYDEEEEYDDDLARRRAGFGCLIAFLVVIGIIVGAALYGFFFVKGELDGKNATVSEAVVFDVAPGSGGSIVGAKLKEEGLIGYDNIFRFYVRLNGAGSSFQTGRFTLNPGMSYDEIIETLSEPPPPRDTMQITFPEGSTVMRFGEIAEKAGLCSQKDFVEAANNVDQYMDIPVLMRIQEEGGWDADTWMKAEGYLAPNTYEFFVDETPEGIVRKLYEQLDSEMTEERYALMEERSLTVRELITMASLVEEEAGDPLNQPGVARVFWNRYRGDLAQTDITRRTMGSDVTFYYVRDWIARDYGGYGDYESVPENYFYAYYSADDDPQVREGLPAGPISCPSATAIDAVLNPATTAPTADGEKDVSGAFYFLTDFYKNYYYARTFSEHEVNVARMNTMNSRFEAEGGDVAAAQAEAEGQEVPAAAAGDEAAGEGEAAGAEDAAA